MKAYHHEIRVGATAKLSLRVSVAALVGVLFDDPKSGQTMLALERIATLRRLNGQFEVVVRVKPFGGAARLVDPPALERWIGDFNYDSERSHREKDFRIQIQPASWEKVKELCIEHLDNVGNVILDSSPERELTEEFEDSLNLKIDRGDYHLTSRGMTTEDHWVPTSNVRAEGMPTVRVYYLFEARIVSPQIIAMMLNNSKGYSDNDLHEIALKDFQEGGKGRANAVLVSPLDDLRDTYRSIPTEGWEGSMLIEGHQLDANVRFLLEALDTRGDHLTET